MAAVTVTVTDGARPVGLAPATRILITLAAATGTVAGLYLARELIGPLAVAALVVMVAHPVRRPLERRGLSPALATAVVILLAYVILIVIGLLVVVAVSQFVALLPAYADQFATAEQQVVRTLQSIGFHPASAGQAGGVVNPARLLGVAAAVSAAVLGAGTAFLFVFAYIVFIAADAATFPVLAARFARSHATAIRVLSNYAQSVRRYLLVNTIFGGIVAALDGLVLWLIGIPGPALWAILAFVTNYIPNVGFVIALVPPTLLALLIGGWKPALLVVAAYCLINFVVQSLVQPKFVSGAVRLSLTLTFLSVVAWSAVLGPVGAVLAIPATLFLRALLLESDPDAFWARWLTGDRADPDPASITSARGAPDGEHPSHGGAHAAD